MSDTKKAELFSAAHAAAFASEFARSNIEKYLQLHAGPSESFKMSLRESAAHFNMKIADETVAKASEIVRASAELAASNLQQFLKAQKDLEG